MRVLQSEDWNIEAVRPRGLSVGGMVGGGEDFELDFGLDLEWDFPLQRTPGARARRMRMILRLTMIVSFH